MAFVDANKGFSIAHREYVVDKINDKSIWAKDIRDYRDGDRTFNRKKRPDIGECSVDRFIGYRSVYRYWADEKTEEEAEEIAKAKLIEYLETVIDYNITLLHSIPDFEPPNS